MVLVGMRISQKINMYCVYLGYFFLASSNSCRSCLTGGPPNVQNSKICCGFFCTVLFSAVRRQCCDRLFRISFQQRKWNKNLACDV